MAWIDFTNQTHPTPCAVFDAEGQEHFLVTHVDTDTGLMYQHRPNGKGGIAVSGMRAVTDCRQVPAPVRIDLP